MSQVVVIHYFTLFDKFYRMFFFRNKETKLPVQIFS